MSNSDFKKKKFPLSHNQKSLYFMERLTKGHSVFNLSFALKLGENVDPEILRESILDVVKYNESLRTVFVMEEAGVFQTVKEAVSFEIPVVDIEGKSEADYMRMIEEEKDKPLDLENGPLFRVIIYKNGDEYIFLLVIHHIISDFWTLSLLIKELGMVYEQKQTGLDGYKEQISNILSYEYFVQRQEESLAQKSELTEYWETVLSGELPTLNLNTDMPRPPVQSWNGRIADHDLSRELSGRVIKFCKTRRIPEHAFIMSIFQILLQKYTGQDDILIGTLSSGRNFKLSETVGYFVNPVAVRADLSGDPDLGTFLNRSKEATIGALNHKEYPFDLLIEHLKIPRDISRSPLFQAMFIYQKIPRSSGSDLKAMNSAALNRSVTFDMGGISASYIPLSRSTAQYELTLIAAELADGIGLSLEYNCDLFTPETAQRMLLSFETLLENALNMPDSKLSEISILSPQERNAVLYECNNSAMPYDQVCLHQIIEKQAEMTPDATAVVFGNQTLTYKDLNDKAGKLANYMSKQGLNANHPAVLCLERSAEMAVGLLAILKAGAYYLPLDPTHPRERLAMIIEEAAKGGNAPLLLTQEKTLALFPEYKGTVIRIDSDSELISREPEFFSEPDINIESLAYTIYTSGSTGRPKGVKIAHRSLVNFLESMRREPGFTARDTLLSVTTISFDIAGLELFLPLISGGKVVIASENEARDGIRLAKLIEENHISIMQATPATWRLLLESGWQGRDEMKILCGGEAFPPELAQKLIDTGGEVWNMYGPTETTVWSSLWRVGKNRNPIPIGLPVGNNRLYVMDIFQNPVPIGVSGELYIGGDGVAVGYTREDTSSAGKFMPDPFSSKAGARMYRTGDLVRRLPGGELEYLGRLDNQIKVRGYRIEAGEIETGLRLHPGVTDALVTVKASKTNVNQLIAYFIPGNIEPHAGELRRFLADKLPDYMIPSYFVPLEEFPLTPNGKINRKKLPDPEFDRPSLENKYVPPKSRTEKLLVNIYKDILGVADVGINDKFFDLGGNSILTTILQNRIMREFPDREISIADLFQHTSVAELAGFLEVSPYESGEDGEIREKTDKNEDIAIIGMSCRFPKSKNIREFWANLSDGRECITFYSEEELQDSGISPDEYNDPQYVRASGSIDDIECFDAKFFNYSPREASLIDPQQRIFLEESWRALEDAGYDPESFTGDIGVYAGTGMNSYIYNNLQSHSSLFDEGGSYQVMISNDKDFLATRVSYELNLTGPSMTVQTACSSSATAVHMACQSIRCSECDMALAGGVSVRVPQKAGYRYAEGMILSPDGHCRAFDENAKGTVIGNGAGVIVLKALSAAMRDGDSVYAVIKGSALNNDGSRKAHYTAPGPEKQFAVIRSAMRAAGVKPNEISYIETHGTGTELGDPIEISALTRAFSSAPNSKKTCAIGSVKTNIGHLDAAAGVAGIIKTALALYHKKIPASLNFDKPNPKINFDRTPFFVNTKLSQWNSTNRCAGVSSFGIGGTNAHLILGEAPGTDDSQSSERNLQIFALSAKSPGVLMEKAVELRDFITEKTDIRSVAYTLSTGRTPMRYRVAFVSDSASQVSQLMSQPESSEVFRGAADSRDVAFLFPGQGSQYVNMGRALYETEPVFRNTMDSCFKLVQKYSGADLKSIIYPKEAFEVSSCTGRMITDEEAVDPDYWVRHLRHTVRFSDAAGIILGAPDTVILELGPGKALSSLIRRHPDKPGDAIILNALPHHQEPGVPADKALYKAAACLWVSGVFDDWSGFYQSEISSCKRMHLPAYPFEKRRCWIEPAMHKISYNEDTVTGIFEDVQEDIADSLSFDVRPGLSNEYVPAQSEDEKALALIWGNVLGISDPGVTDNFFELGGSSLMLTQLLSQMRQSFEGLSFTMKGIYDNPTIRETADYINTLRDLAESENSGGEYEEGEL